MTKALFTYISKRHEGFAISRGFHFRETSHMQSFAKIKPSRKFPHLIAVCACCGGGFVTGHTLSESLSKISILRWFGLIGYRDKLVNIFRSLKSE